MAGQGIFGSVEPYSNKYFYLCGIGGILSCGITHTVVTPLDLVKCNIQANPKEYTGVFQGFKKITAEAGTKGLYRGWAPTAVGYSVQGLFKFGLYEYFKHKYAGMVGEQNAQKYKDFVWLGASASAEFFADIGLCAFEATKVRVQTDPTFARGLADGMPKIVAAEGVNGLFKGLVPLWSRQIPYTMVKFLGFERAVRLIYGQLDKPKDEYNKVQQLGVSFAAGYLAGVFCALVSQAPDNMVSILNKDSSKTIGSIWKGTPKTQLFFGGLAPRIVMIGTLTALQWLIYDAWKVAAGLPTTGSTAKTPAVAVGAK